MDPNYNPGKEPSLYAFWAGSVTGPFVHILAIAHVLLWGLLSSIFGSVVSSSVLTQSCTAQTLVKIREIFQLMNYRQQYCPSCICLRWPLGWFGEASSLTITMTTIITMQ